MVSHCRVRRTALFTYGWWSFSWSPSLALSGLPKSTMNESMWRMACVFGTNKPSPSIWLNGDLSQNAKNRLYLSVAQFQNGCSVIKWLILFKINVFCFKNRFCPDLFVLGRDCFKTEH